MRGDDGGPAPVRRLPEHDLGTGLTCDDASSRVVPRREVQLPVRVDVAGGDVAEVERRRPAAADIAHAAEDQRRGGTLARALRRLV